MPELPEVETVRRGLDRATLDRVIVGGDVLRNSAIAHPSSSESFLAGITGKAIAHWYRRGKYLLAQLRIPNPETQSAEPGGWLGVHLRMTGQLLWCRPNALLQKHTRVRLFFADKRELRFVDQRTFGRLWWIPPNIEPLKIMTGLAKLGPEPFSPEFSIEYLADRLRGKQRSIKVALLDQTLVAGVGNIYADETLFLASIPPTRPCGQLSLDEIERIHTNLIEVLQDSIDAGGTTFSNFLNVQGINGNYGGVAWVYNRQGEPCRLCGTHIERLKLSGRSAHWCPQCQPEKKGDRNQLAN